jgi:hypothetical protein
VVETPEVDVRTLLLAAALAVLSTFCAGAVPAVPAPAAPARVLDDRAWREDLRFLRRELPRRHANAFHAVSREAFERVADSLEAAIPRSSDARIVLGLARLTALVGDGHTRLTLPEAPELAVSYADHPDPAPKDSALVFRHLPVRFEWCADGLFVGSGTRETSALIGARVVAIGGVAADLALARVAPFIGRDNDAALRLFAPALLAVPEVLEGAGLCDRPDRARLDLRLVAGQDTSVVLAAPPAFTPFEWLTWGGAVPPGPIPPVSAWREDRRTLIVRVDHIGDGPSWRFANFCSSLSETLGQLPIEKVVLDLRRNSGGYGYQNRALVLALARAPALSAPGRLFVLIGPRTFSAAVMLSSLLEQLTPVIFVGQPTGGSPNGYGDARRFTLPHSGLTVRASSLYWRDWTTQVDRPWIAPDVAVWPTSADRIAGRDPELAAVLGYEHPGELGAALRAVSAAGPDALELAYFRFRTDPATAREAAADRVLDVADELAAGGHVPEALRLATLVAEDEPGMPRAQELVKKLQAAPVKP